MHELAIAASIVEAASEHAREAQVNRVVLEVGKLSGVSIHSLRFCFESCKGSTLLAGAALEIIEIPARAHCLDCGADLLLNDSVPLCLCGSANIEFLTGHELRIRELEIQDV